MKNFVNENTVIYTGTYYVALKEIMEHYEMTLSAVLKVEVGILVGLANTLKAKAA